jgi:Ca-activated chloride channel family protein
MLKQGARQLGSWFLFLFAFNGFPQDSFESPQFKIRTDVELVLLDVSVKNTNGGYVTGLTRDQFQIYENGVPQKITEFAVADEPVTVGLVMDASGSMGARRASVNEAGVAFIEASNPRDQIFVVNFNDKVRPGLPTSTPFTDNIKLLRAALSKDAPEGQTALYDAIAFALKHLETGRREKKTLVVVSDGGDNCSRRNFRDVMRLIEESAATLYTIGIFDPADPDSNPGVLRRIARVSGGECFLPGELEPVLPICQKIARDIRNRYTIGYLPVRTNDKAADRKLRVVAASPEYKKLMVRTRTVYRLPERAPTPLVTSK